LGGKCFYFVFIRVAAIQGYVLPAAAVKSLMYLKIALRIWAMVAK
jgi:uncharacterized MAPEG superfamily protein